MQIGYDSINFYVFTCILANKSVKCLKFTYYNKWTISLYTPHCDGGILWWILLGDIMAVSYCWFFSRILSHILWWDSMVIFSITRFYGGILLPNLWWDFMVNLGLFGPLLKMKKKSPDRNWTRISSFKDTHSTIEVAKFVKIC